MNSKDKIYRYSLIVIPVVFYLTFWVIDKAVWCADSASYVEMHDCREPLYPTILAFLRLIFRIGPDASPENNNSLLAMAFIQSLLAAYAASSIAIYIYERFRLKKIAGYIVMVIPMVVSLMNRFLATRGSMYSNSILTEGITVSLYLLAIRYMLEFILDNSSKSIILATVLVLIGLMTRKQMLVLAVLLIISVEYSLIRHGQARKSIKYIVTILAILAGVSLLADCAYNKVVHGVFAIHTEDNRFITTIAMYTADREYDEFIEPEFRELFLEIYDECDYNGWLMKDAPNDWYDAVEYFADNYDHIQLDTMEIILEKAVKDMQSERFRKGITESMKMDVIRSSFNRSLLPHEKSRLIRVFMNNVFTGLIDTVAKKTRFLSGLSVIIYAAYFYGIIMCIKTSNKEAAIVGGLVLLSILGNVALVSAVIFCQTRYIVYNMPLFYIALFLMIYTVFLKGIGDERNV